MEKETKDHMDRIYAANDSNKPVSYFIGKEIENTNFKGLDTLFVVGNQLTSSILAKVEIAQKEHSVKIEHIYFSANHSYDKFEQFEQLSLFISLGFKVTYETTNTRINEELLSKLPCGNPDFVFMVSVVLPHIQSMLFSTVIKIDDKDTNRTNPGVWCHHLANLILAKDVDDSKFTSWSEYGNDVILD